MVLEGLLYINNKDAYTTYGAFLVEDKPGDNKNYSELLKPAKAKEHTPVDFRHLDGEKYPDTLTVALEARDITLQFAICGTSKADFVAKYQAFVTMLKTGVGGWINIRLPELNKTMKLYYKECTEWEQLTDFGGVVMAKFRVKFREPKPTY
ncbi:MAG: hypothetical protein RSE51_09860 [Bacteroidales bacterium]